MHKWIDAQPKVPEVVALTPAGVKVFVVKFNDYQCPACRMTYFAYKDIVAKYEASNPQDFRYETRDFPLNSKCGAGMAHAYACEAAVAVRLAKAKDPAKGKELENWLFERQDSFSVDLIKRGLSEIAQVNSFDADYPKTIEAVRADVKLGTSVGVNGTPTFFVNGIRINSSAAGVSRRRDRIPAREDLGTRRGSAEARRRPPLACLWTPFGPRLSPSTTPSGSGARARILPSRGSPSRSARARCSASWAPTAPARPPRSSC